MESTPGSTLPDAAHDGPLIDARFVLPQGAPAEERRSFLHALGYATDATLDLPDGVEAEVAFCLSGVPAAQMARQLEFLRTTLPSLQLEQHPLGSLIPDMAVGTDDDVDDEWLEDDTDGE